MIFIILSILIYLLSNLILLSIFYYNLSVFIAILLS